MTEEEKILWKYLQNLNGEERSNLRHHANTGTKILCGSEILARFWSLPGAGCLEALSASAKVPTQQYGGGFTGRPPIWGHMLDKICGGTTDTYIKALANISEHSLRNLLQRLF